MTSSSRPVLLVRDLSVSFFDHPVLRHVDLEVVTSCESRLLSTVHSMGFEK